MKLITLLILFMLSACGPGQFVLEKKQGCSVTQVTGGVLIDCGDSQQFVSSGINGSDGTNGANGQDATPSITDIVAILNPCGDAPGVYDEVFLKLRNGVVVASFSDSASGSNTRFAIVPTNTTHTTTDGDNCQFQIDNNGDFTYQSH